MVLSVKLFQLGHGTNKSLQAIGALCLARATLLVFVVFLNPAEYPVLNEISHIINAVTLVCFISFFFGLKSEPDDTPQKD